METVLGILFICLSIAFVVFLLPDFIPLVKRTPYLLLEPKAELRREMQLDWFWQFVGWIIAYFSFWGGRSFLRGAQKSSMHRK
jgi:hypothetical protein